VTHGEGGKEEGRGTGKEDGEEIGRIDFGALTMCSIDVINVFYVFYSGHVFYVFNVFLIFFPRSFIFKKRCQMQSINM